MAPESMSQMDAGACAALSQNMDFDVVVPLEHVSQEDREARDRARRLEYEREIRANTTLMSALLHVFQVRNVQLCGVNMCVILPPDWLTAFACLGTRRCAV